jgi:serine/threonine protein kinase
MSEKTVEVKFEDLKKAGAVQAPQTAAEKPPPNFVFKRELGTGGMGIVYEAIGKIQRRVAVKVMTPKGAEASRKAEERFRREGEILKRLRHRNIVELYDTFSHEGSRYIVMEFLEGKNLYDYVKEDLAQKHFTERVRFAVRVAVEASRALLCAHANKVIHRDIKPANIFISAMDGPIKILDFGIARDAANPEVTTSGSETALLTPEYAAPEQLMRREANERADIYSLGASLVFILTGRAPFSNSVDPLTFERERKMYSTFEKLPKEIPTDLLNIIHRCLLFEPMHRYGTALDLLEDLDRLRPDAGGKQEDDSGWAAAGRAPRYEESVPAKSPRHSKWLLDFVFILVIAIMAVMLGGMLKDNWDKAQIAELEKKKAEAQNPSTFASNVVFETEIEAMRTAVASVEAENRALRAQVQAYDEGRSSIETASVPKVTPSATPAATVTPSASLTEILAGIDNSTSRPAAVTARPTSLEYLVLAERADPSHIFVQIIDPAIPESELVSPTGPHVELDRFYGPEEALAYAITRAYAAGDGSVRWGIPDSLSRRGELPLRVRGGWNITARKYDRNLVTVFSRAGSRHIADVEPYR